MNIEPVLLSRPRTCAILPVKVVNVYCHRRRKRNEVPQVRGKAASMWIMNAQLLKGFGHNTPRSTLEQYTTPNNAYKFLRNNYSGPSKPLGTVYALHPLNSYGFSQNTEQYSEYISNPDIPPVDSLGFSGRSCQVSDEKMFDRIVEIFCVTTTPSLIAPRPISLRKKNLYRSISPRSGRSAAVLLLAAWCERFMCRGMHVVDMARDAMRTEVESPTNHPTPVAIMGEVFTHVARVTGWSLPDPTEKYRTEPHGTYPSGVWLNPVFMHNGSGVADAIRAGALGLDFELRESHEGEAPTTGPSHFTSVFVREGHDISSVVERLHETGQLEVAAAKLETVAGDRAREVVAFALARYLAGAAVEKVLAGTERFSKGSVSNDQAGQDLYDRETGRYIQLKSVTHDTELDDHLYYQFDGNGGLWVGESSHEVNEAAYEASGRSGERGFSKTLVKRSAGSLKQVKDDDDRSRTRYLAWNGE